MACLMIELPKVEDIRGNLSFIESGNRGVCPFEIERVYWIYDVPTGRKRNGRALRHTSEMIVAMSGSFDVVCIKPDGTKEVHSLNRSDRALHIPPGTWREINNFSTNSVAMVLASGPYNADEYIFDPEGLGEESPQPCADCHEEKSAKTFADPHKHSDLANVRRITFDRHKHANGTLSVAENGAPLIPFDIRRVFYLYDVPADAKRGGHSHYQAEELIIALSGSFDVVLDDGKHAPERFSLNRPYTALYVPTGLWRTLDNFSGGSVCMVLTSERYSEPDYVRDYQLFKQLTAL